MPRHEHSLTKNVNLCYKQVGDAIPSVEVMEGTPKDKVDVAKLFEGKKGILFAVPGAFTPGCSKVRNNIIVI